MTTITRQRLRSFYVVGIVLLSALITYLAVNSLTTRSDVSNAKATAQITKVAAQITYDFNVKFALSARAGCERSLKDRADNRAGWTVAQQARQRAADLAEDAEERQYNIIAADKYGNLVKSFTKRIDGINCDEIYPMPEKPIGIN